MFHWICPECGREIAPTVRECPVCDGGAEQAELVLAGVVEASARTVHLDTARGVQGDVPGRNGSGDVSARSVRMDERSEPVRIPQVAVDLPKLVECGRTNGAVQETPVGETLAPVAPVAMEEPAALIPEILDAKSAADCMEEARIRSVLGNGVREAGTRTDDRAKSIHTRTVESRAVETRPIESRAAEAKTIDTRTIDAKPLDTRPIDTRVVETRPVESRPLTSKNVESKTVEAKIIEAKPIDPKVIDAKPVESKSLESKIPEPKTPETKSKEQKIAEPEKPLAQAQPAPATPIKAAEAPPLPPPIERVPLLAKLSRLAPPRIVASSPASSGGNETYDARRIIETERPHASAADAKSEATADATDHKGPDAKAGVAPEAVATELLLPTFDSPALESLHSLVAAVGALGEDAFDELGSDEVGPEEIVSKDGGSEKETALAEAVPQVDPPTSGKLPLPEPSEGVAPAAQIVAGREGISPEPTLPRAVELAKHAATPEYVLEKEVAPPPMVETAFPLTRPTQQAWKGAAASASLAAAPPRAGAVRAPRSRPAFLKPRMARLVKYSPLAKRPLRPVPPPEDDLRKSDTEPKITLPGPMLTRGLVSFQERDLTPIFLEAKAFRKKFAYGWVVIVLVVGTILGVGISSMLPAHAPDAKTGTDSKAVVAEATSQDAPAPAHATGANPLSKVIEVTGFRIVMDPERKPEVEYLVVNHSSSRFSDATVYVTLHAADARVGQPPLCKFSFTAPSLGAFEAKEMVSAIEKTNRPINLPDWQDLRAEIEIGQ